MRVYDIVHAYQPFEPPFFPSWVEDNLRNLFLPLSRAVRRGIVKRHVQLQGWTIEVFLRSPDPVKSLAQESLDNLKSAYDKGHISLGFSAYSHPIIPLLSDEVLLRSIREDFEVVREHLGEPIWFWFPEGACDRRSLKLLFDEFPDVTAVIPDGCIGQENLSGFYKLENGGRVVVFNSILKDIFMNAEDYGKPQPYTPEGLRWEVAEEMITNAGSLLEGLQYFSKNEFVVLGRDWENAGSKYGLLEFEKGAKELKSFLEVKDGIEFGFVKEAKFEETLRLSDIRPSSWEPAATDDKPYPYWNLDSWVQFVDAFCSSYESDFPKKFLIALASDVPWHLMARKEWGPNPEHSRQFLDKAISPIVKRIGNSKLTKALDDLADSLL